MTGMGNNGHFGQLRFTKKMSLLYRHILSHGDILIKGNNGHQYGGIKNGHSFNPIKFRKSIDFQIKIYSIEYFHTWSILNILPYCNTYTWMWFSTHHLQNIFPGKPCVFHIFRYVYPRVPSFGWRSSRIRRWTGSPWVIRSWRRPGRITSGLAPLKQRFETRGGNTCFFEISGQWFQHVSTILLGIEHSYCKWPTYSSYCDIFKW